MKLINHKLSLLFIAMGLVTQLSAQTLTTLGTTAPTPGPNDLSQLKVADKNEDQGVTSPTSRSRPASANQ